MPSSACLRTTALVVATIARSSAPASYGSPDSRACSGASSSRGRGRLPTCVVRIRRSLRFMSYDHGICALFCSL